MGGGMYELRTKKIFVGGLPHNLTDLQFREYFDKFGEVTDCIIMQDKDTQKPRGNLNKIQYIYI